MVEKFEKFIICNAEGELVCIVEEASLHKIDVEVEEYLTPKEAEEVIDCMREIISVIEAKGKVA